MVKANYKKIKKANLTKKFEKHEDIWKKIEENNRDIWEKFVKNMKKILKLERNSNEILEK